MSNESEYKQGASQVLNVLSDALRKYGLEDKVNPVEPSKVQILFAVRPDEWSQADIYIRVFREWEPALRPSKVADQKTDEISISNLLGIKFDMFNKAGAIKSRLLFTFDKMLKELKEKNPEARFGAFVKPDQGEPYWQPDLELICVSPTDEPIRPMVLVYHLGEQIKILDIVKDIL